jgi:molecular chaperone GrpE
MGDKHAEQQRDPAAAEHESDAAGDGSEAEVIESTAEELPEQEVDAAAAGDGEPAAAEAADGEGEPAAESELDRARRERDEYLDLAQRARADLDNYRRRTAAEAQGAERRGRSAVARDLIPALDNLERALLAAGVDPAGDPPDPAVDGEPTSREVSAQTALAEGVALVYRELLEGLRRSGVEPFDPLGERFDPATCEAVATGQGEGVESGAVLEVLEKGYRIGDQVLRPARVVVNG